MGEQTGKFPSQARSCAGKDAPRYRDAGVDLDAAERAKAFTGAIKVAAFNGWSIGFFAAVTLLFGIFSLTALVLGVGMAVVARNEFKSRARILTPDPTGPELLWRNQVGFMALIILYCLWSMYVTPARPDPQMAELTELLGGDLDELVRSLTITVYVAVIALTAVFQGLNARYYFRRITTIEQYLSETPDWVLELQKSAGVS